MIFGSKLTNGIRFGSKMNDSGTSFGGKLRAIGSVLKTGGDIFDKAVDIKNDLERIRG